MRPMLQVFAAGILAAFAGDAERIDALVAKAVAADGPGVAVLVTKDGKRVHSKGYGLADVEAKRSIDVATTFDLASCGKQFTAYALLILEERGKLALTDEVQKLIPELAPLTPTNKGGRTLRIEDLLHHVSGLPDYLDIDPLPKKEAEMTNADIAALIAKQRLRFPIGTKFEYSNTNYALAGLLIERASGVSYARFLQENLFKPLGMSNSHVYDQARKEIPHGARGYSKKDGRLIVMTSDLSTTGDGGIWTCLDDFMKWDEELREPTLVERESLERAWTSGKLDDGAPTGYGFGWGVQDAAKAARIGGGFDEPVVEHSGSWCGFLSDHLRLRESQLTVVVLCNTQDGSIRPAALAHQIAKLLRAEPAAK